MDTRPATCVDCRGNGAVCDQCGQPVWDDECEECRGRSVECLACGGQGSVQVPTPAAVRDAKYFGSPTETARLRREAEQKAANQVVAAPIVGFQREAPQSREAPLRWHAYERDVVFSPHEDGRERVRLTRPNEDAGDEVDLPSVQTYRTRAALSPSGKRLAVGSPTFCRRVDVRTGKVDDVLQGPWQIAVGWLDEDKVVVLTQAGHWKLRFDDPDVAAMPAVKSFPKGRQQSATMQTTGMLHVVDTRQGAELLVSLKVTASEMDVLRGGRLIVLRREPPNERSWGTLLLRSDEGRLTSIAKFAIDIGEVSERGDALVSAAGFEILGLNLEEPTAADHRLIKDGLEVEEAPPPPPAKISVPKSPLSFHLVADVRQERTGNVLHDRFAWVERYTADGVALAQDESNRFFLVDDERGTISLEPAIKTETIEFAWAGDRSRLVLWSGRRVWEVKRDGSTRVVVDAAGPVTCAAALSKGRTAVSSRLKATDGELDVYAPDGSLSACVPIHPFDQLWSLAGGTLLIVGHKNAADDQAAIHALVVGEGRVSVAPGSEGGCLSFAAKQTRFGSETKIPIVAAWDVDGVGHVQLRSGAVYRVTGDLAAIGKRFGAAPRLDRRVGSDLFLDRGYIDTKGEWRTDPIWKGADDWQGGRGRVHFSAQGQIALVNEEGRVLTPPCFSEIHPFREEVAAVSVGGVRGKDARCAMINSDGAWVAPPIYDFVGDVSGGFARVQREDTWGLISTASDKLADDFAIVRDMVDGRAFALPRGASTGGYLKTDGTWAFQSEFIDSFVFAEGLAAGKLADGKWAFVTSEGDVLTPRFKAAWPHKRTPAGLRAPVRVGDGWGYVDERGELTAEATLFRTFSFSGGMAPVRVTSERWSYVDAYGVLLNREGWDRTFDVYEDIGWFKHAGKLGAIDATGSVILEPVFDAIRNFAEGVAPVRRGELWGIVDTKGTMLVEPRFQDAASCREGRIAVKEGDLWGFLDLSLEWAIQPAFRSVGSFSEGRAHAQRTER
ncbi:MAG: WG repeat-containing protein, partial [Myxococcota bacterium]